MRSKPSDYSSSGRYLRKEDLTQPARFSIADVSEADFDGESKLELVLSDAHGNERKMTLNKANLTFLIAHFGDNFDTWTSQVIEAYNERSVEFHGKAVGGVRLRVPTVRRSPVAPPVADDDIPF